MKPILRFPDLVELGLVNNWTTLNNWIAKRGFPPGHMLGRRRVWTERSIVAWIESQPTENTAPCRRPAVCPAWLNCAFDGGVWVLKSRSQRPLFSMTWRPINPRPFQSPVSSTRGSISGACRTRSKRTARRKIDTSFSCAPPKERLIIAARFGRGLRLLGDALQPSGCLRGISSGFGRAPLAAVGFGLATSKNAGTGSPAASASTAMPPQI